MFLYFFFIHFLRMWLKNSTYLIAFFSMALGIAITTSISIVYAQSSDNGQNATSTILKNAGQDLSQAIEALNNNNITGAVDKARSGVFYLEMLGIPNNCVLDNNEMLQCGFPR